MNNSTHKARGKAVAIRFVRATNSLILGELLNIYIMKTELTPVYDSRASFYQKATVITTEKGLQLQSYETTVAQIEDGCALVFGNYSQTTLRHIKEFLKQNGFKAETKKQILNDYME